MVWIASNDEMHSCSEYLHFTYEGDIIAATGSGCQGYGYAFKREATIDDLDNLNNHEDGTI